MSTSLLTLGSHVFRGLEVPESVLLSTKQRLVVHHLASGSAVVDSLGEDCEIVSFHGIFAGTDAASRIQSIEDLRSRDQPIGLTWGSRTLPVMIQRFDLRYSSSRWILYRLSCYVVGRYGTIAEELVDAIFASPETRVDDILAMLQSTGVSTTSDQTAAILDLARESYDVAPPESLRHTTELLDLVDHSISRSALSLPGKGMGLAIIPREEANSLVRLTAAAGRQSELLLARNRLAEISVRAQCVNQK
jgi:hypothetical protein